MLVAISAWCALNQSDLSAEKYNQCMFFYGMLSGMTLIMWVTMHLFLVLLPVL